jgi:hypothetical protein
MGWATQLIARLQAGETVQFRPRGHSMTGRVNDRDLCTVAPITEPLKVDDVVLCRVAGAQYLHRILAIRGETTYQIGNNRGGINGWISRSGIYGKLIMVEP